MLEVKNLEKRYGELVAVDDVSFRIESGEFATLLGPSGCGKTTTLHVIAGLVEPDSGSVHLRGTDVTAVPPNERNIGLVFQDSALFPHMTVERNIRYGLEMQDFEGDFDAQIEQFLDLVQMSEYGDHKPDELSGGQQRRISFARALAYEPDILLLDEPLTGLDRVLREEMRNEIHAIHEEVDVTTLHVTHDQTEALSMSDKVLVMNDGVIEQEGDPQSLYDRPNSEFVAEFVGKSTKFEGELVTASDPVVRTGDHDVRVPADVDGDDGRPVSAYVRPEVVTVARPGQETGAGNALPGTVRGLEYLGHRAEVEVVLADGTVLTAFTRTTMDLDDGDEVVVEFDPTDVIVV